ncbi:MAG: FecR domain-containing protein [Methylophilaceae bacterium]
MKKISHLVAIAAMSCLMFSGAVFAVAGKFQFVNGTAQVTDSKGQQRSVAKGGEVNEGDTVATSADGFTQIKMEDGGFFAVRPNTTFKIDTFTFNGKEDGSEKGAFSLIKGSLRAVTGLIGKTHRENYKVQTATSTIGIRGSGADMGEDPIIGTAVRTLFGGHTLTKRLNGKDFLLESGPGQIMLAKPDGVPEFVPNFPFDTGTGGSVGKTDGGGKGKKKGAATVAKVSEPPVIPVKSTDGFDFTNLDEEIQSGTSQAVGGGGAAVGLYNGGVSTFIDFNVVDVAGLFTATVNGSGAVEGWRDDNGGGSINTFAVGSGTVIIDGSDASLDVIWGRWSGAYTASNTVLGTLTPFGDLAFIQSTHITTVVELAALPGLGVTTATYTYSNPGFGATALFNGSLLSGPIIQASASVNFSTLTITSYVLDVIGPSNVGTWSVGGGGTLISQFMGSTGMTITGSCSGAGSGTCASLTGITGQTSGGFVGTQAQGLISTYALGTLAGDRLNGVVYIKR